MPIINVQMWAGRTDDAKERLIKGITDATASALEIDAEAVTVILTEVEKKHWGAAGLPATKKWPD